MIYNWMRMLFAVLLGNVIYFAAQPVLPETEIALTSHKEPTRWFEL